MKSARPQTPSKQDIQALLFGRSFDEILASFDRVAGAEIQEIERSLPKALLGKPRAAETYAESSRELVFRLLSSVSRSHPDLVTKRGNLYTTYDFKMCPTEIGMTLLVLAAVEAPFSSWINCYGVGRGSALHLLNCLRTLIHGAKPLTPKKEIAALPHWEGLDQEAVLRFRSLVESALQRGIADTSSLARVKQLFGLNLTELGALFGTSRQAASEWLGSGIPSARLPKLQTVLRIGELLSQKLKAGSLPAVSRKAADAFEGLTIIQMIELDRQDQLMGRLRESFDWASTA